MTEELQSTITLDEEGTTTTDWLNKLVSLIPPEKVHIDEAIMNTYLALKKDEPKELEWVEALNKMCGDAQEHIEQETLDLQRDVAYQLVEIGYQNLKQQTEADEESCSSPKPSNLSSGYPESFRPGAVYTDECRRECPLIPEALLEFLQRKDIHSQSCLFDGCTDPSHAKQEEEAGK